MMKGKKMPDYTARRVMMVDTQVRTADVTKYTVIGALLDVAREDYVPAALREAAYVGENLAMARDRVLLEPRTLAKMLDALDLGPTDLVLDVGAALGYSSAVIGRIAEAVVALEEDAELAAQLAAKDAGDTVIAVTGPLTAGAPTHAPFDAIVIEGGVEEVPQALTDQLKLDGRIAALFMEGALGTVRIGIRKPEGIVWRDAFNAAAPVIPGFARAREFAL